ncbi:MAG: hypothetical protein RLZZ32_644, partial [Cyanobacteriota bacterium]
SKMSRVLSRSLAIVSLLLASATPTLAQGVQQTFEKIDRLQQEAPALQRAMNLARNKAVLLNGGLTNYVPAECMFSTSLVRQSCLSRTGFSEFVFTFSGGTPGWQAEGRAPSVRTKVVVSADGKTVLNIQNTPQ